MVDEVGQFPASVDRLAGDGVGSGHGPWPAAEDTNFAHLKTTQFQVSGYREEGGRREQNNYHN